MNDSKFTQWRAKYWSLTMAIIFFCGIPKIQPLKFCTCTSRKCPGPSTTLLALMTRLSYQLRGVYACVLHHSSGTVRFRNARPGVLRHRFDCTVPHLLRRGTHHSCRYSNHHNTRQKSHRCTEHWVHILHSHMKGWLLVHSSDTIKLNI